MVRAQILKARGESRDSLLERGNTRTSESKITFSITYYSVVSECQEPAGGISNFASTR